MRVWNYIITVLIIGCIPISSNAGVFPPTNHPTILYCGVDRNKHYQVDVSLFPRTIRVNNSYLELQSSTDANDGFKVGIYKQTGGLKAAMLAVREGYKPVLIENNTTYVCS